MANEKILGGVLVMGEGRQNVRKKLRDTVLNVVAVVVVGFMWIVWFAWDLSHLWSWFGYWFR